MEATDKLMPERDDVIYVVAGRAASAERRDSRLVRPLRHCIDLDRPSVRRFSFLDLSPARSLRISNPCC